MRIRVLSSSNGNLNTSDKTDHRLSIVICWMMISLFIINFDSVLEPVLNIPADFVSIIAKGILLLLIICNLGNIYRRITKELIIFILFGGILFLINYMFASNNEFFISTVESFLINILPVFIIMISIENGDMLVSLLVKVARWLVALSVFFLLFARGMGLSYSMGFANALSLPVILAFYDYYKTRKTYKLILAILGVVVIIVLGSRGALLGIGVYVIVLLCRALYSKENRLRSIVFITMIMVCLAFYNSIINAAILLMDRLNIYSRTLYLLVHERTHDSGRNVIYDAIIDDINKHPFHMRGIAGEYSLTNGAYAHNFILELLCDFGILIGGAIIIYIVYQVIKTVSGSIASKEPDIYMIFMAASIPIMLVSGSIWTSTYFWLWFAIILKKKYYVANEVKSWEKSY